MNFTLTIWDEEKIPNFFIENIIFWKKFKSDNDRSISIPSYLELNADKFKNEYLSFINNLGQDIIENKSIIEHLETDKNLSFWWLNHLSEKSPFKSPYIYSCLKLLALKEIILEKSPDLIVLHSNDDTLKGSINEIANNNNILFKHLYIDKKRYNTINFKLQYPITYIIKALFSNFKYLIKRWPLKKIQKSDWIKAENSIFICSYFIHLNKDLCEKGIFHSHHWEKLPELLNKKGFKINWLHHFLFSKIVPDTSTGLTWINKFNAKNKKNDYHCFLDTYLTFPIVIKAYRRWIKLILNSKSVLHLEKKSSILKSNLFLWNYLKDDWWKSLVGPIALRNCLWLEIFDDVFKHMPHQQIGFYLYENQDWESALLFSWNKYGHGKIIGVQHSTVPFWHLYYFDHINTLNFNGKLSRPTPYQIAVNGKHSWDAFINQGYNSNKLIKVEALRYLYLNEIKKIRFNKIISLKKKRVLIIGDLNPLSLHRFLNVIEESIPFLLNNFEFTIKPHPGLAIDFANYPNMQIPETSEPFVNLLNNFQIAISSNSTSAALETYLVGLHTIVYKDATELDLSPLRDQSNVSFFTNANELITEMNKINGNVYIDSNKNNFLFLEQGMKYWANLIDTITVQ